MAFPLAALLGTLGGTGLSYLFDKLIPGGSEQIGSASDVRMINQGNYDNWMKQMLGQGGYLGQLMAGTSGMSPQASANALMSMQPAIAKQANSVLSDVYRTGRSQAQAAADDARRQAAGELANAGLLQSGAGIGAMTEATARPMMEMETNLANARANYIQNMMGQTGNLLGAGYQGANSLIGQILGLGTQMNEPVYWQPQYRATPGGMDFMNAGANFAKLFV